jgi:hypothetical protein
VRIALAALALLGSTACDTPRSEVAPQMPQPIVIASDQGPVDLDDHERMVSRIADLEQRNLRLEKLVETLRAR